MSGRTERDILSVLDMLYEGMLDEHMWPRALVATADLVSGSAVALFSMNPTTGQVLRADVVRADAGVMPAYQSTWINQDPRHAASLACPIGEPQIDGMLVTTRSFHRTAVFNEFLKPADIPYHLATWIERRHDRGVVLSVQGTAARGAFTEAERRRFQILIPHFRRIVELKDRLAAAQLKADTLLDTMEQLPFGLLLLTESLQVLEASESARQLLLRRDGLHADDGHLGFIARKSEQAFAARLRETQTSAAFEETTRVQRLDGRPSLALLTLPLTPGREQWLRPAARWLVLVFDPESTPDPPARQLQKSLGISAAEAALARLIATGMSVSRAAETLGISRNTARAQLKSIYAKTGHNTQAKLVARILSGPALLKKPRES